MFAIVEIAGHQYKVSAKDVIKVNKIDGEAGKSITLEQVLLVSDGKEDTKIGKPFIQGAKVTAKVIQHGRGKKTRVFKMKAKKRYSKTYGHRQDFTELEIEKIAA